MVKRLGCWFVVAPLLVWTGFVAGARYGMLFGYPFWIGAGCIWAFPLAEWLARPFISFLQPGDRYWRPQPMYSIPESLRKQNKIQEAFDAYRDLARKYPKEVRPWGEMIRLAHLEWKNDELTEATYQQGLRTLHGRARKEELTRMHDTIVTLRRDAPTAEDRPTVAYRKGE